jgi:adenylate cyclase
MTDDVSRPTIRLRDIRLCFEGAVPAVIATASSDGTPNVTYLSCVRLVDDERVALSNQFFSKTARNLAENPRASVLLIDPTTYDEYRLTLAYERTDRRGPVFDRLREDVEATASLSGMEDVFKLRAADIYRVVELQHVPSAWSLQHGHGRSGSTPGPRGVGTAPVATLSARLSRCPDLDTLVEATVAGLDELFGYEHSLLMLLDEHGRRLYTIASHGYDAQGVGSEVAMGDGIIGTTAERCTPIRLGNLGQMSKYADTVRRSYEDEGGIRPGRDIPLPGLDDAQSCIAVPAMALGELTGVLMVEDRHAVAFDEADQEALTVIASQVAAAIEIERMRERADEGTTSGSLPVPTLPDPARPSTQVRFFAVDGSTFLDGDYLIKGVAGRILWSLLNQHMKEGRVDFTNKEVRLDRSLELPEFRDNLDSRLILLKRRLDERAAPIRIEKTGRGRFRLHVDAPLDLDLIEAGP